MSSFFHKYEGLGNDYLVVDPATWDLPLTPERIRLLCDRHFGLGSDGILLGPLPAQEVEQESAENAGKNKNSVSAISANSCSNCLCKLRILNPDGSEAEKSGNGLRIFARYLLDTGRVLMDRPFRIRTAGGIVTCTVFAGGRSVQVDMGCASFASREIPVAGPAREVLNETVEIGGRPVRFCAATVGNPHCVVLGEPVTPETAGVLGPKLEIHPLFPNRTNVQFMEILNRNTIRIEIWERGAGYTLASGSSSSAAAAVAHKLGLCDDCITVKMPGGELNIEIGAAFTIRMTGPVRAIARGEAAPDLLEKLNTVLPLNDTKSSLNKTGFLLPI